MKKYCYTIALSALMLLALPAFSMPIFVIVYSGEKITLEVEPSDTIEKVKEKIAAATKISVVDQKLDFKGHRLENHKKLSDYKIGKESTLEMVLEIKARRD